MSTAPAAAPAFSKGLAGVIAAETSLSSVDGTNGVLTYRGLNIHDLAGRVQFEEVAYLLWNGSLPTAAELTAFQKEVAANRELPGPVSDHIASAPVDRFCQTRSDNPSPSRSVTAAELKPT